jgi:hypothetical protein
VIELQEDLGAGRLAAVCAALAPKPQLQLGTIGHGRRPTTCVRDLRSFIVGVKTSSAIYGEEVDLRRVARPRVTEVRIASGGARAKATMTLGGDPFDVPLVLRDGSWKVADLFGVVGPPPRALQ